MNPGETDSTALFVQRLTSVQSRLYAYLCTLLVRSEDARDVLQETNVILWKKAGEYDEARPFEPWAFRFARWQAMAWRKRQSRDRLVFDETTFEALAGECVPEGTGAEHELRVLEECLAKLPAAQRALVERRYSGGETVQAIAAKERKAPNAVAALLYRVRKLLADCVESALLPKGGAA